MCWRSTTGAEGAAVNVVALTLTPWKTRSRACAISVSRSIAYRFQELAHGGLSKATRRRLLALTKVLQSNGSVEPDDGPNLRPGARLVREWRGRTHTVQVTEDGFEYDGKPYSSLSKIAHAITGAHWSGPRFFGLNRKPTPAPRFWRRICRARARQ